MHYDENTKPPPAEPSHTFVPDDPTRYTRGTIETWDAIIGLDLGYLSGNVVKYLCRYDRKGGVADLIKGLDYYLKLLVHLEVPADQITEILRKHDFTK